MKRLSRFLILMALVMSVSAAAGAQTFSEAYVTLGQLSAQLSDINRLLSDVVSQYGMQRITKETVRSQLATVLSRLNALSTEINKVMETITANSKATTGIAHEAWEFLWQSARNLQSTAWLASSAYFSLLDATFETPGEAEWLLHVTTAGLKTEIIALRLELEYLTTQMGYTRYAEAMRR